MTLLKKAIIPFLFLSHTVFAQSQVNWDDVNSSFVTIVDEHVDSYDFLESGVVVVDKTKSDLNTGNFSVAFDFKSSELNLVSTSTPQRMSLVGLIDLKTTADTGSFKRVDFDISIELQSDVLAVLRHINQLFSDCPANDPTDIYEVEICNYIQGVETASSAAELKSAIDAFKNALVSLLPASAPTSSFEAELVDIVRQLNVVQQVNGVLISTVINQLDIFGMDLSGDISLNFSDSGIKLQITGATLLSTTDYNAFLDVLEQSLIGIQNKDSDTFDTLYSYTFGVFDLLEGIFL